MQLSVNYALINRTKKHTKTIKHGGYYGPINREHFVSSIVIKLHK